MNDPQFSIKDHEVRIDFEPQESHVVSDKDHRHTAFNDKNSTIKYVFWRLDFQTHK